ncbi:MAG: hypothetical protein ACFFCW_01770, partial [Candidatus Hodarchaeota archaeon]
MPEEPWLQTQEPWLEEKKPEVKTEKKKLSWGDVIGRSFATGLSQVMMPEKEAALEAQALISEAMKPRQTAEQNIVADILETGIPLLRYTGPQAATSLVADITRQPSLPLDILEQSGKATEDILASTGTLRSLIKLANLYDKIKGVPDVWDVLPENTKEAMLEAKQIAASQRVRERPLSTIVEASMPELLGLGAVKAVKTPKFIKDIGAVSEQIASGPKAKAMGIPTKPLVQPASQYEQLPIERMNEIKPKTKTETQIEVIHQNSVKKDNPGYYPLLQETQYRSGGQRIPATDDMLARFVSMNKEEFGKLGKADKKKVRELYNKELEKQKNEYTQAERLNKEFNIVIEPEFRESIQKPAPVVTPDLLSRAKDIGRVEVQLKDPFRINEKVLPREVADALTTEHMAAIDKFNEFLLRNLDEYTNHIEKTIGIKPNSKLDRAVQLFGEKTVLKYRKGKPLIADENWLIKKFGEKRAAQVVEAAQWYRQKYEQFLGEYNKVAATLYPGEPKYILRRRADYFRHFRDLGDLNRLLDIVEEPGGILDVPSRINRFVRPIGKRLGILRQRLGKKTDLSAAAGYSDYLHQVGYGMEINPLVEYLRRFQKNIESATAETGALPNYRNALNQWINGMSGVPHFLDAALQEVFGKGFDVTNWLNRRAKQNTIIANMGAVLAQPFNIPQAIAEAGSQNFAMGISRSLAEIFMKPDVGKWRSTSMSRSPFMKHRYMESHFNKFRYGWIRSAKKAGAWIMRTADEISTKAIWNSFHIKAIREGIENPILYADKMARKMVAGRGIGELPALQHSRIFQIVAPFQIEVGNAMWAFMDLFKGERKFSRVATFTLASWMMNRMAEEIRGTPVSFDPLGAMQEGFKIAIDERRDPLERVLAVPGRLTGEALSNVPLGQTVARLYPEGGFKIGDKSYTRKEIFGTNDPTRFGSTVMLADALNPKNWPSRLLLPFGGIQAKKTAKT